MRYEQIYDRIDALCEERGWSRYKLVEESGMTRSSFYNMFNRRSIPRIDLIQRVCDGFNISLAEFFADKTSGGQELSEDDIAFLEMSRALNTTNREKALAYMQAMMDVQKIE